MRTRPISSTSRKPRVVMSPVTAPIFWRMVLDATVVPWTISVTSCGSTPAARSSAARPVTTARPGSSGVDETLLTRRVPSGSRRTMSVKVPPMSTPTCTAESVHSDGDESPRS